MPPLECSIEKAVGLQLRAWAWKNNVSFHYLKLSVLGQKGFPDRLLLWPWRNALFIEFKRPGEQPRKLQVAIHTILQSMGFVVKVYDNVDIAVEEVKAIIKASYGTTAGHGPDSSRAWGEAISTPRQGKDSYRAESLSDSKRKEYGGLPPSNSPTESDND